MNTTSPALILEDIERTHGTGDNVVHALRGVSLTVAPGELVAVMGPSGSGKSTLLNIAGGLDRPTSGRVIMHDVDLSSLSSKQLAMVRRRQVGFVFQDYNLIPALTAAQNVGLPMELDGASPGKARRAAIATLEQMGLAGVADRFPDALSGGQQQRLAIARALVGTRSLVMADEPTGALDTTTGEQVLRVLRQRCDEGAAGLLVTHESRHAAWADRTVFLRDGVVVDDTGANDPTDLLTTEASA